MTLDITVLVPAVMTVLEVGQTQVTISPGDWLELSQITIGLSVSYCANLKL